jgi:hypothetical protein
MFLVCAIAFERRRLFEQRRVLQQVESSDCIGKKIHDRRGENFGGVFQIPSQILFLEDRHVKSLYQLKTHRLLNGLNRQILRKSIPANTIKR